MVASSVASALPSSQYSILGPNILVLWKNARAVRPRSERVCRHMAYIHMYSPIAAFVWYGHYGQREYEYDVLYEHDDLILKGWLLRWDPHTNQIAILTRFRKTINF
ncbi:hypothetical protein ACJX0J_016658, partial [Zea mays]